MQDISMNFLIFNNFVTYDSCRCWYEDLIVGETFVNPNHGDKLSTGIFSYVFFIFNYYYSDQAKAVPDCCVGLLL